MNALENYFEEKLHGVSQMFRPEALFLAILFLAGFVSIVLMNNGVLPLHISYVSFYFLLLILYGLYRPTYLWLAVVFFLPFEILTIFGFWGVEVRLYQFGMFALFLSGTILWLQGKLILTPLRWFDLALAGVIVGALFTFFVNALPKENFQQVLVLFSLGLLYALGRIFTRKKSDVYRMLNTLQRSAVVVSMYAIYQAVAFKNNWIHFMVMSGRPNSTFEEADWLGFFLGMVAIITLIQFLKNRKRILASISFLQLILFLVALILTVSRSAWLGFLVSAGILTLLLLSQYIRGYFHTREYDGLTIGKIILGLPLALSVAFFLVFFFQLTRFDLNQRLASTGTGNQVITVACNRGQLPPKEIAVLNELSALGCEHINLEDQEMFQQNGYTITTTERPDPNIEVRQNIYRQSFVLLKENPLFGLGWGKSLKVFGTDGRGTGLNSSNIFIEVWLGSGLIGVFGLIVFFLGVIVVAMSRHFRKRSFTEGFWFSVLILALWIHVVIFNLFNTGLFLGTFIAFLIMSAWYLEKTHPHLAIRQPASPPK